MDTPMLGESAANSAVLKSLVHAIEGAGSDGHVDRLIDLIGALVKHDRVTVVRYSATQRPEFVSHRNYSDAMVRKYLDTYYVYDPFYAHWRAHRQPGVVVLGQSSGPPRGPYVSDFLGESDISDEIGVLLEDGGDWCLGIFLDRIRGKFTKADRMKLEARCEVFAALHALDIKARSPGFKRTAQEPRPGQEPAGSEPLNLPAGFWPELSAREREVVQLILAGHPSAGIARKLGIAGGTVKNHRRRIYEKLDITTERELFLQYIGRGKSPPQATVTMRTNHETA